MNKFIHNPFDSNEGQEHFFGSTDYVLDKTYMHRTPNQKLLAFRSRFKPITKVEHIEYSNYDILMVLGDIGGLHEVFLILTAFIMGPYQSRSYASA